MDKKFEEGMKYLNGEDCEQDLKKASKLLIEAADLGHSDACMMVGIMYQNGDGVKQNFNKALEYYQKACDLNNEYALELLNALKEKIKEMEEA